MEGEGIAFTSHVFTHFKTFFHKYSIKFTESQLVTTGW